LTLCHALLERGTLLWRHRRHPFFHPLATLFRRHVRIEPAATAATETTASAAVWITAWHLRWAAGHSIAAAASFVR
jgi:hypothetical protein